MSGVVSASRAIAIVAVLKTMSLYEGTSMSATRRVPQLIVFSIDISDDCQTVMTFYATSLQSVVGPHFKAPDVVYLARQWLDASSMSLSSVWVIAVH